METEAGQATQDNLLSPSGFLYRKVPAETPRALDLDDFCAAAHCVGSLMQWPADDLEARGWLYRLATYGWLAMRQRIPLEIA